MRKSTGTLLTTAVAALMLVVGAFIWPAFLRDRTGRALIGNPVDSSISVFLAPGDLKGTSFILLSDMYVDECNERLTEMNNFVVKLTKEGTKARILHIGSHAYPFQSYEEAVNAKRGPTHMILADESIAYANKNIYWLAKPCLLELSDGEIVRIRVGPDFDQWIDEN